MAEQARLDSAILEYFVQPLSSLAQPKDPLKSREEGLIVSGRDSGLS